MPPYEHRARIRFHQGDPAHVLFYGRIFELLESAYEDMLRAAGVDIDALMRQDEHTTPVVHAEVDYAAPIPVGEEVLVEATVERVGTSSIAMRYEVRGTNGELRATARVVHVHVVAGDWAATPVPADLRERLARFGA